MTEATAITAIAGLAAGYVIAGLALQHAAYILQYGSIFTSAREWLERTACAPDSAPVLRWLCARVRELVGCQLCSITQLALWFCALPATALAASAGGSRPLGLEPSAAVLAYVLFGLGVMFSTAAAGMICWDLARLVGRGSDALVLYLRAQKDLAQAELLRRQTASSVAKTAAPAAAEKPAPGLRILRSAGSAASRERVYRADTSAFDPR